MVTPMHLILRPDGRELPGVRDKLHEDNSVPLLWATLPRSVGCRRHDGRGVSTAGRTRRLPARSGLALESTRRRMDRPIKISLRDGSCECEGPLRHACSMKDHMRRSMEPRDAPGEFQRDRAPEMPGR